MITMQDAEQMIGAPVVDRENDRIGEIRQVFLDSDTEQPVWVGVRVGLLGAEVLVPLGGADWDDHALHTAVSRSVAKQAPSVDLDEPLTADEEDRLLWHYGIPCVRHPRGEVDLPEYADASVSYSVNDEV